MPPSFEIEWITTFQSLTCVHNSFSMSDWSSFLLWIWKYCPLQLAQALYHHLLKKTAETLSTALVSHSSTLIYLLQRFSPYIHLRSCPRAPIQADAALYSMLEATKWENYPLCSFLSSPLSHREQFIVAMFHGDMPVTPVYDDEHMIQWAQGKLRPTCSNLWGPRNDNQMDPNDVISLSRLAILPFEQLESERIVRSSRQNRDTFLMLVFHKPRHVLWMSCYSGNSNS